jgi:phenylalanyl-tRNA synthetase beta chain
VISAFPPVLLDVALTVDGDVPAARLTEALRRGGGDLLESVRLFDVYVGEPIPAGKKSLAFALTVRSPERTLTNAQASDVRDAAIAAAAELGAALR